MQLHMQWIVASEVNAWLQIQHIVTTRERCNVVFDNCARWGNDSTHAQKACQDRFHEMGFIQSISTNLIDKKFSVCQIMFTYVRPFIAAISVFIYTWVWHVLAGACDGLTDMPWLKRLQYISTSLNMTLTAPIIAWSRLEFKRVSIHITHCIDIDNTNIISW